MSAHPPAVAVRLPGAFEHLVERNDRDKAAWLGTDMFQRQMYACERAWLAGRIGRPVAPYTVRTRVEVAGGLRRRSWPETEAQTRRDSFDAKAGR